MSQELSAAKNWAEFLHGIFGNSLLAVVGINGNNEWQKHGIDKVLFFANGKQLTVDEKLRRKDYGDFSAEIWSPYFGPGDKRNKPGWTVDPNKRCDFIAYGPSGGRYYFIPYEILRVATRDNYKNWEKRITTRDLADRGYSTINRVVTWDKLFRAMERTMTIQGSCPLKIQKCGSILGQDVFGFMQESDS